MNFIFSCFIEYAWVLIFWTYSTYSIVSLVLVEKNILHPFIPFFMPQLIFPLYLFFAYYVFTSLWRKLSLMEMILKVDLQHTSTHMAMYRLYFMFVKLFEWVFLSLFWLTNSNQAWWKKDILMGWFYYRGCGIFLSFKIWYLK